MSQLLITKAGQDVLAKEMKKALDKALMEGPRTTEEIMTSLIILLIGGHPLHRDLMDRITGRDGGGGFSRMEQVDVEDIAIETIKRLTNIIPPARRTSAGKSAESYQIGELIGSIINADVYMSSLAIDEVLEHVPRHTLMALIPESVGPDKHVKRAKLADLRAMIVDAKVDWHPTSFNTFTEDLAR
ncbi:Putative phage protein [Gluconobacter oxydans 621H]|uniref:Putative phage protein n=1 Tax=Gluconobacter oxydans (strain 621H) TaxID=290633 RepID=Q5FNJ5_GLUOX|nr:hypothetical protein [Gluconobacter oxydans]AAW62052.1 Putative phage protein [Gluconobacter oxydans 621H]